MLCAPRGPTFEFNLNFQGRHFIFSSFAARSRHASYLLPPIFHPALALATLVRGRCTRPRRAAHNLVRAHARALFSVSSVPVPSRSPYGARRAYGRGRHPGAWQRVHAAFVACLVRSVLRTAVQRLIFTHISTVPPSQALFLPQPSAAAHTGSPAAFDVRAGSALAASCVITRAQRILCLRSHHSLRRRRGSFQRT